MRATASEPHAKLPWSRRSARNLKLPPRTRTRRTVTAERGERRRRRPFLSIVAPFFARREKKSRALVVPPRGPALGRFDYKNIGYEAAWLVFASLGSKEASPATQRVARNHRPPRSAAAALPLIELLGPSREEKKKKQKLGTTHLRFFLNFFGPAPVARRLCRESREIPASDGFCGTGERKRRAKR